MYWISFGHENFVLVLFTNVGHFNIVVNYNYFMYSEYPLK